MTFNLDKTNATYSDLKRWYMENLDELPWTLDGKFMFIEDVKGKVLKNIENLDGMIEKQGKKVARNPHARSVRDTLFIIYEQLQNEENWNVGLPQIEKSKFKNKMI